LFIVVRVRVRVRVRVTSSDSADWSPPAKCSRMDLNFFTSRNPDPVSSKAFKVLMRLILECLMSFIFALRTDAKISKVMVLVSTEEPGREEILELGRERKP
jgi:hypothetical protein